MIRLHCPIHEKLLTQRNSCRGFELFGNLKNVQCVSNICENCEQLYYFTRDSGKFYLGYTYPVNVTKGSSIGCERISNRSCKSVYINYFEKKYLYEEFNYDDNDKMWHLNRQGSGDHSGLLDIVAELRSANLRVYK